MAPSCTHHNKSPIPSAHLDCLTQPMNALALQDNPLISPEAAAKWFLHDMAEVSGFLSLGIQNMSPLSVYASYRPILTKPDPWYYAGVVALELSAVTDLYTKDGADEIMRAVFEQMDAMIGRQDDEASELTMLLLGRLGIGSVLMGRRVPENMMSRIMLLLLGSDKNAKKSNAGRRRARATARGPQIRQAGVVENVRPPLPPVHRA